MIEPQIDEYMDKMSQVSDYINYSAFIDLAKIKAEQEQTNDISDFTDRKSVV